MTASFSLWTKSVPPRHLGKGLSDRDTVDSPPGIARENGDHFRDKGKQFLQSGATGDHDDDGDRKVSDALLIREPLVHRDEDIEPVVSREAQQLSVGASGPTHLLHCARFERLGER